MKPRDFLKLILMAIAFFAFFACMVAILVTYGLVIYGGVR